MKKIVFVSYDGKYPNLCRGVLTLNINGKDYRFGHNYSNYDPRTGTFRGEGTRNFDEFWVSGGGLMPDYEGTYHEEWQWNDLAKLPSELLGLENEMLRVFNENVPHGCCGGCI